MPSTYTNNLGVQKPADGEQDGVWGDVVNDNMDIIDRAINGSITLVLTGTTSTLTTTDGTLSNGQYKALILGGSPSGTHTITVAPNDAQKIYFVYNLSGQSVIFTQGSGTNVTIATSDTAIIYCDGGGTSAGVVNLTDNFAMNSVKITGGVITGITDLAVVDGGTGASDAATARTNLGAQATITGAATTITTSNLTVSRALTSDGSGKVAVATTTAAELNFVAGVTSAIQTQLDARQPLDSDLTAVAGLATNGLVTRTGAGTATTRSIAQGSAITVTNGDGVAGDPTVAFNGAVGTVSVTATTDNDGTFTTGTYTPTPVGGNFKVITNGGAFTLAAPSTSSDYTLVIRISNNASAGAITLTGFTKVTGDAFTTVNGNNFFVYITVCNGLTAAVVQALQ